MDNLKFVRLKIPRLIPVELIEGVKGRTYTPEQFYDYQEAQNGNPHNYLYAVIDESKKIHGYLWAERNLLDGSLFINTFSIGKEFWGKGKAMEKAMDFVKELNGTIKASRIFWVTTNAAFYKKHGLKESKQKLMEFQA